MDTEIISAFRIYSCVSASLDAGGYATSRHNNLELQYLLIELF